MPSLQLISSRPARSPSLLVLVSSEPSRPGRSLQATRENCRGTLEISGVGIEIPTYIFPHTSLARVSLESAPPATSHSLLVLASLEASWRGRIQSLLVLGSLESAPPARSHRFLVLVLLVSHRLRGKPEASFLRARVSL